MIGELKKLQVLSMVGSDIQQLPREMMQLTNLRLLDLNYCEELKVIPRDILSSLSRLECLFMKSCFSEWAAEEVCDGDINACLSELNNLHRLRTIEGSKSVTKASAMKEIKKQMEKDVDEVGKIARNVRAKLEAINKSVLTLLVQPSIHQHVL